MFKTRYIIKIKIIYIYIIMNFAPYNELDVDLEELEKNNKITKCLSDRPKVTVTDKKKLVKKNNIYNIKCNNIEDYENKIDDYNTKTNEYYNDKDVRYVFDSKVRRVGECDNILYDDKVKSINNERENKHKLTYNKKIKQLYPRMINTIPYRVKKEHEYNPENEIIIQSGLLSSNKKSSSNLSEIQSNEKPLNTSVKNYIDNKKELFDISRLTLSTRQLKGNKSYFNEYKKKINSIKKVLN